MKTFFALCANMLIAKSLWAAATPPLIPVEPGTTWKYKMTHEAGENFDFTNLSPDAGGKIQVDVAYRIDSTEKVDGKDMLKFEMHRQGLVTSTEFMTVDDRVINCWRRVDLHGEVTKLNPPQPIVLMPLKTGETWNFDTKLGADDIHQHYAVLGEEEITVPAGQFRAVHVHGQQNKPNEIAIDRWFVQGTGIVKDVTATRNRDGDLVSRITLELLEPPKVAPRPEIKSTFLAGSVGKDPGGAAVSKFNVNTPSIYARWQGRGLPDAAVIKVLWVAEDVGDVAPANYTIDESTATATAAQASGVFTLTRPEDGWAEGTYRVEFFLNDELADTVKLSIGK